MDTLTMVIEHNLGNCITGAMAYIKDDVHADQEQFAMELIKSEQMTSGNLDATSFQLLCDDPVEFVKMVRLQPCCSFWALHYSKFVCRKPLRAKTA